MNVMSLNNQNGLQEEAKNKVQDIAIHRESAFPDMFYASAVAYGNDIYVKNGYDYLIPHEIQHVRQQRQGKAFSEHTFMGYPISQSHKLEKEADNTMTTGMNHDLKTQSALHPVIQCYTETTFEEALLKNEVPVAKADAMRILLAAHKENIPDDVVDDIIKLLLQYNDEKYQVVSPCLCKLTDMENIVYYLSSFLDIHNDCIFYLQNQTAEEIETSLSILLQYDNKKYQVVTPCLSNLTNVKNIAFFLSAFQALDNDSVSGLQNKPVNEIKLFIENQSNQKYSQDVVQFLTDDDNPHQLFTPEVKLKGEMNSLKPELVYMSIFDFLTLFRKYSLFAEAATFTQTLKILKDCCGIAYTKKAITAALQNNNSNFIDGEYNKDKPHAGLELKTNRQFLNVFVNRLVLTSQQVKIVYDTVNWSLFGTKKDYIIEPTGSDPHLMGTQALFICSRESGKRLSVYKPRSLNPDRLLTGEEGVFAVVNNLAAQQNEVDEQTAYLPLPTMKYPNLRYGSQSVPTKFEPVVQPLGRIITPQEADHLLIQLGEMNMIGTIVGGTDMHKDNIIMTEKGPVVIDAECSFVDFAATGILGLEGPIYGSDKSGDHMDYAACHVQIGEGSLSLNEYRSEIGQRAKQLIKQGEDNVKTVLRNAKDKFEEYMDLIFKQLHVVRVVPIATGLLSMNLRLYHEAHNDKGRKKIIDSVTAEAEKILRTCENYSYIHPEYFEFTFYEKACEDSVEAAFKQGTIPAFQFQLDDLTITLDTVPIMDLEYIGDTVLAYYDQVMLIKTLMLEFVMKRFHDVIDS